VALFDDATARRACVDHTTLQTSEPFLALAHSLPARGTGTGPDTHIDTTYPTAVTDQFVPAGVTCPGPDPLCDAADCHALDPGLDTTDWVGAFRPGGENWLRPDPGSCWISFADR
jgi:hypothetical protein